MNLYLHHIQYLMASRLSHHGCPSTLLSGNSKDLASLWDTEAELHTLVSPPKN